MRSSLVVTASVAVGASVAAGQVVATGPDAAHGGLRGGSPGATSVIHDCVPPQTRAKIESEIANVRARGAPTRAVPPLYGFYPHGGNLGDDIVATGFVDLDPTAGILSYDCDVLTYDGHRGHDTDIRSWAEQIIGVPVFAVADGTVMFAHDGDPDMTLACDHDGNYLIIDHGGGRDGWYFHMRNGSLTVGVGDPVVEGQQIGLTASSGCSFWPHLHFESQQDDVVYEPNAGPCRPGPSGWVSQPTYDLSASLRDFGVTTTDLNTVPGLPEPMPRDAEIDSNQQFTYFWTQFHYLPANSEWRVRFRDPNGVEVFDSGPVGFLNPELWRAPWFWWQYDVISFNGAVGEWTIVFEVNGDVLIEAPVRVVSALTPGFNRPPEPIGAAFDPSAPDADAALFCRVQTSPTLDDLDWDVVSYHYEWFVNGVSVRDIVSAGHADAIRKGLATDGDIVLCRLTPNDGTSDGPGAFAQAFAGCKADTTTTGAGSGDPGFGVPDGAVTAADLQLYVNRWVSSDPLADLTTQSAPAGDPQFGVPDGQVTASDIQLYVNLWIVGCP